MCLLDRSIDAPTKHKTNKIQHRWTSCIQRKSKSNKFSYCSCPKSARVSLGFFFGEEFRTICWPNEPNGISTLCYSHPSKIESIHFNIFEINCWFDSVHMRTIEITDDGLPIEASKVRNYWSVVEFMAAFNLFISVLFIPFIRSTDFLQIQRKVYYLPEWLKLPLLLRNSVHRQYSEIDT